MRAWAVVRAHRITEPPNIGGTSTLTALEIVEHGELPIDGVVDDLLDALDEGADGFVSVRPDGADAGGHGERALGVAGVAVDPARRRAARAGRVGAKFDDGEGAA